MKVNVFASTRNGGRFTDSSLTCGSVTGIQVSGPVEYEDEIINMIDEDRTPSDKKLAIRFLKFLTDRNLTVELLGKLSVDEQIQLKQEFIED